MKDELLNKSYGLVLEGGGARGAYQIGVWKAIRELGINISAVVGTSVGALNGALFAQGDYEKALNIWENIRYSSIINIEDDLADKLSGFKWREVSVHESGQQFLEIILNRGFDITPLKKMLNEVLDEQLLRDSKVDFGLVTFNITDFKPMELMLRDIDYGQVAGYLLASSYLPSFSREKIFGKRFLDGAFHSVLPTSMLVDQGYKDIIEVKIQGIGFEKSVDEDNLNIITIEAQEDLGGVLELNPERAKLNINLGYFDTMKIFDELVGNKYYIIGTNREASYLKEFLKLSRARVEYIISAFGGKHNFIKYNSKERLVCEVLIPLVAKKLKLDIYNSYQDIYFQIIEYKAEYLKIERFETYTLADFKQLIIDEYNKFIHEETKELSRIDNIIELATWLGV